MRPSLAYVAPTSKPSPRSPDDDLEPARQKGDHHLHLVGPAVPVSILDRLDDHTEGGKADRGGEMPLLADHLYLDGHDAEEVGPSPAHGGDQALLLQTPWADLKEQAVHPRHGSAGDLLALGDLGGDSQGGNPTDPASDQLGGEDHLSEVLERSRHDHVADCLMVLGDQALELPLGPPADHLRVVGGHRLRARVGSQLRRQRADLTELVALRLHPRAPLLQPVEAGLQGAHARVQLAAAPQGAGEHLGAHQAAVLHDLRAHLLGLGQGKTHPGTFGGLPRDHLIEARDERLQLLCPLVEGTREVPQR